MTDAGVYRFKLMVVSDLQLHGVVHATRRCFVDDAAEYLPVIVNEHHLRRVLTEYLRHYNTARPHRALGQLAPAQAHARPPEINLAEHRIRRRHVLGGLTHEYHIAA